MTFKAGVADQKLLFSHPDLTSRFITDPDPSLRVVANPDLNPDPTLCFISDPSFLF